MVENDPGSDPRNKPAGEQQAAAHALITQERTQKLELLIHLLANLTQPLVVCGPKGIGKTTLLGVLQQREVKAWHYCTIKGSVNLSFEAVQTQLATVLSHGNSGQQSQSLSALLMQLENQKRKIVLIIDDAGVLVPGLITSLIHYAMSHRVLRLIFVLTHDELHVQSRSDHAIEDCHFIEIPPLSESQCGEFLQQLAKKPNVQLSFNAINDNMIATIYRETHGIPGRIIAGLPHIAVGKQKDNARWLLPIAVAVLIAVALTVQWFSTRQIVNKETIASLPVETKVANDVAAPTEMPQSLPLAIDLSGDTEPQETQFPETSFFDGSVVPAESLARDANEKMYRAQNNQKPELLVDKQAVAEEATPTQPGETTEAQPPKTESTKSVSDQQTSAKARVSQEKQPVQDEGWQWLAQQPDANYTIQLMVLSKLQSIIRVLNKYPAIAQDARIVKNKSGGKERYFLLYGSFATATSAIQAKAALPAELNSAIVRQASSLKKVLKPAGSQ